MKTTKDASPLVSVILPVYNREMFLAEAIESILRQTYDRFEVIIADDGSTDNTAAIIRRYGRRDNRIRPFFLSHNGLPRTLNTAASFSEGPITAFMDSDDIAAPDRLEIQMQWMQGKKLDLCGSEVDVFGTAQDPLGGKDGIVRLPESHGAIIRELLFQIPLWRSALMLKTSVIRENPFDENFGCTDCEWPYRVALRCITGNVPRVLLNVRRHGGNITTLLRSPHRIVATKSRFNYFYQLFPRTPLPDYIAFARLADGDPMTSLWELERAGQWLVQFAAFPDDPLKERMRHRWAATCRRSIGLGDGVERLFKEYREKI